MENYAGGKLTGWPWGTQVAPPSQRFAQGVIKHPHVVHRGRQVALLSKALLMSFRAHCGFLPIALRQKRRLLLLREHSVSSLSSRQIASVKSCWSIYEGECPAFVPPPARGKCRSAGHNQGLACDNAALWPQGSILFHLSLGSCRDTK